MYINGVKVSAGDIKQSRGDSSVWLYLHSVQNKLLLLVVSSSPSSLSSSSSFSSSSGRQTFFLLSLLFTQLLIQMLRNLKLNQTVLKSCAAAGRKSRTHPEVFSSRLFVEWRLDILPCSYRRGGDIYSTYRMWSEHKWGFKDCFIF